MMNSELLEKLKSRDAKAACDLSMEMCRESALSDKYYSMLDDFIALTESERTYERVRGFRLACAQAKWDSEGRLDAVFDRLLLLLNDEKPTSVRQYLAVLGDAALYKPALRAKIIKAAQSIDLSKYKSSMSPLIQKDAEALIKRIGELE